MFRVWRACTTLMFLGLPGSERGEGGGEWKE